MLNPLTINTHFKSNKASSLHRKLKNNCLCIRHIFLRFSVSHNTPCSSSSSTDIVAEPPQPQTEREPVVPSALLALGRRQGERGQVEVRQGAAQVRLGQVQTQEGTASPAGGRRFDWHRDAVTGLLRDRGGSFRHVQRVGWCRTVK